MASYLIGIVGESNYQPAIKQVRSGQTVELVAEPANPYDSRAISAQAGGQTIGYLPRDCWLTKVMIDQEKPVTAVIEEVTGGEAGKPALGIVLRVFTDEAPRAATAPEAGMAKPEKRSIWIKAIDAAFPDKPEIAKPPSTKLGCFGIVVVLVVVFAVLGQCSSTSAPPPAAAVKPVAGLNPKQLALCAKAIKQMTSTGLIRDRPEARRMDVDEANWAALANKDKSMLLQFLSCDAFGAMAPPKGESVVAYGYHSGERLRMLTADGVW